MWEVSKYVEDFWKKQNEKILNDKELKFIFKKWYKNPNSVSPAARQLMIEISDSKNIEVYERFKIEWKNLMGKDFERAPSEKVNMRKAPYITKGKKNYKWCDDIIDQLMKEEAELTDENR